MMFTYDISKEALQSKGCRSLYEYLYLCIKEDILEGRLSAGERLPSKRELAKQYGISLKTVQNAYEQLIMEGYIYAVEKSGYFVEKIEGGRLKKQTLDYRYVYFGNEDLPQDIDKKLLLDLTSNRSAAKRFPYSTWAKVMREVLSCYEEELLRPVPFAGIYELRAEIARYLYEYRGMEVSPAQIVVGAGREYLYSRVLQLLGREQVYGLEDPGYQALARLYRSNNIKWEYVGIDENGLSVKELEKSSVNVVRVSPGHHFPTGIIMPAARRRSLLEWARQERGRYIIEDDYDSEFRFSRRPIPAIQSMDLNHRVIYINTFSKILAPSIRIGYMVLPSNLMDRYVNTMSFYSCTASSYEQYAMAEFMKGGYFERHIHRMKNYYKNQRDAIFQILRESPFWNMIEIDEKDAGNHFLMKLQTELSDTQLKWVAQRRGILLDCLSEYCAARKEQHQHTVIINYSDLDIEHFRQALKRLEEDLL